MGDELEEITLYYNRGLGRLIDDEGKEAYLYNAVGITKTNANKDTQQPATPPELVLKLIENSITADDIIKLKANGLI